MVSTITANEEQQAATAQAMVDDATHYVDAVSALAGHQEVIAAEDIVSASGIKLVARGARIDAGLREKLAGHRLSGKTLDKCLAVPGGVTAELLATDIARLIDGDPWFVQLAAKSGDVGAMRHGAARLKLPREVLFKLSVARDQRPLLYRHLLGVAIIGQYLALSAREKPAVIDCVVAAALCHDLGELLTDPAVLEPGHRVSDDERRFIYVHPISGWLMVRDLPCFDAEAARAILQHHERLDGSGYPFGRKDAEIGLPGRILAAADIAATIMARFGDHSRLATLLRLNQRKYDRNIIGLLHQAVGPEPAPAAGFEHERMARRLAGFASVLDGWGQLRTRNGIAKAAPGIFLAERMFNLRSVVVQFGFDPDSLEMPAQLAEEDETIAAELTAVIEELQFQLADLGREFDRRSPDWQTSIDPAMAAALADWRQQLNDCIVA